jgi:hypothetical protein
VHSKAPPRSPAPPQQKTAICIVARWLFSAAEEKTGWVTAIDSKEDCEEPRHTGVRYGTNIVRWGIATLATYGKVAIVITIIAR